jgi:hypothetical protein
MLCQVSFFLDRLLDSVGRVLPQHLRTKGSVGAGVGQSVRWPGYGLDNGGSIPGRDRDFSLRHRVQTRSVAHPPSYPVDTGGISEWVKRPKRKADHFHPVPWFRICGAIPPLPHISSWFGAELSTRNNFTFILEQGDRISIDVTSLAGDFSFVMLR